MNNEEKKWHICQMLRVNKNIKIPKPELKLPKTLLDGSYNKTFLFLLPLSNFEKHKFEDYFIHCFYDAENKKVNITNCIYVLCEENKELHNYIKSMDNYLYNYCVGVNNDKKYHMYCLTIPEKDYKIIVQSRYSELSKETKNKILKYTYFKDSKRNNNYSKTMDGILNKRIWYKKQLEKKIGLKLDNKEYASIFDNNKDKEIYLWQQKKK